MEKLILGEAWRLDAFSAYLFRTWLLSAADDSTTDALLVRCFRSSRTKKQTPQFFFAYRG
jgi:hypothetical protein